MQSKAYTFPMSFAQQRLWFLDQWAPHSPLYNTTRAFRLGGPLHIDVLQQSLNEIIRRHEALRTTFQDLAGAPVQVINPHLTLSLPVRDLRHLSEAMRASEARRLVTEASRQPFALDRGPLLRAMVLKLGDQDHIFVVIAHHIVSDGWSEGVFFRELSDLYEAFVAGQSSPLPGLPIQYADFAVWQRQQLQGDMLEEHLAYWRTQLDGAPDVLALPTDRPRPAVQTYHGTWQAVSMPSSVTAGLKALSRQEGVTLFMTLMAAWQLLMARYTGQTDISIGTPIANRIRTELEPLIGFLVNTLVLRTKLSDNPTFRELLHRVRRVALEAYEHQELPFEKLVEALQPERTLSHAPLFQVLFAFQNMPGLSLNLSGLTSEPMEVDTDTAKFDLSLFLWEEAGGLVGRLEYDTDLFEAGTIRRLLGHYRTLLEGIVAGPETPVDRLPLCTPSERQQMLQTWNRTRRAYPREACLHHLVEARVSRSPEALAVVFDGQAVTYGELNRRANQLAHYLRRCGVGPDVLVGVCLERSVELLVALLGILKAGGAYVPLDPAYPPERLAFMAADAQMPILLTQRRLIEDFPEPTTRLICLDRLQDEVVGEPEENPQSGVTAAHLAYVIYTSGSTGRPKGVMISHANISNHIFWMQETLPLTSTDGVVQKTPMSFDASVWEFFAPLVTGARLILSRPGGPWDTESLVTLMAEQRVTVLQLVPAQLRALLDTPGLEACTHLRRIFCGGEALTGDLPSRLLAQLHVRLYNLYGPTEATIDATWWACTREDERQAVPIGRPIANTQVYVLDAHLQPVPIGLPGELYIGGSGLARGYLQRPALTAERFLPHPFSDDPGARLYRTGDLVRYLPDGTLEFLGRRDHQVKMRGLRIELGEVEAALRRHPMVRETTVLAQGNRSGEARLVAYIVPNQEPVPTLDDVRHFLRAKLPDYMLPAALITLPALPLTPNGKVDRQALPVADASRPDLKQPFMAPGTEVEAVVAGIWADVLGLEKVGRRDNFFVLGGHSLLAVQVMSRLFTAFKVKMPIRTLFESPTIEAFALVIEEILVEEIERLSEDGIPAIQIGRSRR